MRDAFLRVGADVRSVGPDFGATIWGMKLESGRAWKPDGGLQTVWDDWMPELVVSYIKPVEFNARYRGVPHVVHTVDNHHMNFRGEGIDHYFMGHLHTEVMPPVGAGDTWLPCAYDPAVFTPGEIPFREREFDVAMIGELYAHRVELVRAIKQAGIKVMAGMGAVYEEYRNVYHQARISLCVSACGDVGQRIFETAAMNCVVLSDPCADFGPLGAEGIDIYRSAEEAVGRIKYWLANPDMAEGMILRSSAWARPHTWDARARTILRWLEGRGG
jgi:hypothetical protein